VLAVVTAPAVDVAELLSDILTVEDVPSMELLSDELGTVPTVTVEADVGDAVVVKDAVLLPTGLVEPETADPAGCVTIWT